MQAQTSPQATDAEVIYIGDIVIFFLRRWTVFLAAILLAVGAALLYLFLTTPLYKASATVGPPTSSNNSSKAGGLAALPFGLGSALGDGGGSTLHKQFLQTLKSYDVAAKLAADKEMVQRLLEPKEGEAVTPSKISERLDSLMVVNKLRNAPLEDTTFTEITLLHADPAFAQKVLNQVFDLSDTIIRRQVRESKTAQREVLLRSLEQTSNSYQRDALVKNLLEVEHELMTSQTDEPFSYRIIESMHAGDRPASPRRLLTLAGSMVVGGILGFLVVCVMLFNTYRRNRGRIV
ncbi:Wzz/FepE/Etk N-terminal domain-containing protein [Niveispirillum lacus]|nr:Wzz/FepE/Etk N-terminal domain-containing protein [Niveispirillum lacus]